MINFSDCVKFVLEAEGDYVNDPKDPGGETRWGISKRQYPDLNIRELTQCEAIVIYQRDYWDAVKADLLPSKLRLPIFDCAVNQGVGTAKYILQYVLRTRKDGILGPITLALANKSAPRRLVIDFMTERSLRYARTRGFERYGKGWTRRLFSVALS